MKGAILFLVISFCSSALASQKDSSWSRIPTDKYGSTVKVLGESQGAFWTWSMDPISKKHFLNRFDTVTYSHVSSTQIDTANAKAGPYSVEVYLLDIYALRDGFVAITGPSGSARKTECQRFVLTNDGKLENGSSLVPELIPEEQKLTTLDFVVGNDGNSLIAVYYVYNMNKRSNAGCGLQLARFDARTTRIAVQSLAIPDKIQSGNYGPDQYELRKGKSGEFYILGRNMNLKKGRSYYYVICVDSLLKKKYDYVLDWGKREALSVDVFSDGQKNTCLIGTFKTSATSQFIYVAVLDSTGKMIRFTEKSNSTDCMVSGYIFIYGRASSYHLDGMRLAVADYVTNNSGVSTIVLDYGRGTSTYSNMRDGAITALHTMRAIVRVNADHSVSSFETIHETYEGRAAGESQSAGDPKYAATHFRMTSVYSFGEHFEFARYVAANCDIFLLNNGGEVKIYYNSGLVSHSFGCSKDRIGFDSGMLQTYSLNFTSGTWTRALEFSDYDGILFLHRNYIWRSDPNKVVVVKQKEGQQFLGTVAI